jgi:hypothetical protein
MTFDKRIDSYIATAPDFAEPILKHIRDVVHEAVPRVEETMKWSTPSFEYDGMMCGMAAFKKHCMMGFWKAELLAKQFPTLAADGKSLQRLSGIRSIKDLPPKATLIKVIRAAAKLNEDNIKTPRKPRVTTIRTVRAPADLLAALRNNAEARAGYDALSPSHKREYIEWITEARRDETRRQRVMTAVEWMAEGKIRNWKYVR